jgi:hypothetical protein
MTVGPMVDRWNYPAMFAVLGPCFIVLPVAAAFLEDKKVEKTRTGEGCPHGGRPAFGRAFFLLLSAGFLVIVVHGTGTLGGSLDMSSLGFPAAPLASAITVAGVVGLESPYLLGWLSDRPGSKAAHPGLLCAVCSGHGDPCGCGPAVALLGGHYPHGHRLRRKGRGDGIRCRSHPSARAGARRRSPNGHGLGRSGPGAGGSRVCRAEARGFHRDVDQCRASAHRHSAAFGRSRAGTATSWRSLDSKSLIRCTLP